MPKLYLVRHAEPAVTGVLLGQCDPPLSEAGRAQAAGIALPVRLAAIYSSPLRRALETARLLGPAARIETLDDLQEITYGNWDGKRWEEIETAGPDLARWALADWRAATAPGGERWADFEARVASALRHVLAGPSPCAIVAHQAVNACVHEGLTGAAAREFQQSYGEVLAYEF
ncbi:MAG: histidine phosphatase family protein [Bryobacteraceae bacterium]